MFTRASLQKCTNKIEGHAEMAGLCMYAKDFQRNFVTVHRLLACMRACKRGLAGGLGGGGGWGGDDRRPGGTETSVADSTPLSFYYQIIHDKQRWRLAKVRRAGRRGERGGKKKQKDEEEKAAIRAREVTPAPQTSHR